MPDDIPPRQEVISQSEVELLLTQISAAESSEGGEESVRQPSAGAITQNHVFPPFSFFSPVELRKLRLGHEEFIRALTARLSFYLRMEIGLQMARIETMTFQKFAEGLSDPTHLTLVRFEPLTGICLLDIPPRLGLAIVDRELGGTGVCQEDSRDLTRLEGRLLSNVIEIMVAEWCGSWSAILDLRPVLAGHESSIRFVETSALEQTMLVLGVEIRIGDMSEEIQFALPHETLEPLVLKLCPKSTPGLKPARPAAAIQWNSLMGDCAVNVTAEIPMLQTTARQLAELKPGDILPISGEMLGHIQVCLEKTPEFRGRLGSCGERWAVQIQHRLESAISAESRA